MKVLKLALTIFAANISCDALAAQFLPVGDLRGGAFASYATDMSSDGRVVVGLSHDAEAEKIFRWTAAEGMKRIGGGTDEGPLSYDSPLLKIPAGPVISGDGQTIVWQARLNHNAYSWTPTSGTYLSDPNPVPYYTETGTFGSRFLVDDISGDGSLLLGTYLGRNGIGSRPEIYERSAPGNRITDPSDLNVSITQWVSASAISADGSIFTGTVSNPASSSSPYGYLDGYFAYVYSLPENEFTLLGDLAGNNVGSDASGISANGKTVVGSAASSGGYEAFRWDEANGMIGLGDLPGGNFSSRASDVSADGTIVVGTSSTAQGVRAFVWSETTGMLDLQELLVTQGVLGLDGWKLIDVVAISDDGLWISGTGINPNGYQEGFLVEIGPIPLPGAAWMLISGLIGLFGYHSRRTRT